MYNPISLRACVFSLAVVVAAQTCAQVQQSEGTDGAASFASTSKGKSSRTERKMPMLYVFGSIGGGFELFSSDDYKTVLDPFSKGGGFGYLLGIGAGIKNFYQFEYRPRTAANANWTYETQSLSGKTIIEIKASLHISDLYVHKFNLFFKRKPRPTGERPALFITYGTSKAGTVKHVDKNGDGFLNGKDRMIGLEAGILIGAGSMSFFLERHRLTFSRFSVRDIGSLEKEFVAITWFFGFRLDLGVKLF